MEKVGIIVLNYNNYLDTIECIRSLEKSTYSNLTIIIIDNCSTDNSFYMLKNYLKIYKKNNFLVFNSVEQALNSKNKNVDFVLIQSNYNGGYGYGNNIGIKYALNHNIDYIFILNNDTVVDENSISNMVEYFKINQDSNIGILGAKIYYYDDPDRLWFNGGKFIQCTGEVKHFNFGEKDNNQTVKEDITFITGCVWFIHKDVFKKVGLINESYFMYFEDVEFCYRVLKYGYKLDVCDKAKVYHKIPSKKGMRLSSFSIYWRTRNKIVFIKNNITGICKTTSYIYTLIIIPLKYLLKKRPDLFLTTLRAFYNALKKNGL